jgi:hypothetical protein
MHIWGASHSAVPDIYRHLDDGDGHGKAAVREKSRQVVRTEAEFKNDMKLTPSMKEILSGLREDLDVFESHRQLGPFCFEIPTLIAGMREKLNLLEKLTR